MPHEDQPPPNQAPPVSQPDDVPQTAENTCRACAGTGRLQDGQVCPDCNGTGRVTETVGDA